MYKLKICLKDILFFERSKTLKNIVIEYPNKVNLTLDQFTLKVSYSTV